MIEGETIWNSTILSEKTTNQKASWWGEQGTKSTAKKRRSSVFMYCLWGSHRDKLLQIHSGFAINSWCQDLSQECPRIFFSFLISMFNSKHQNEWQQKKVASAPKEEKEKSTTDTLHLCGCFPAGGIEPVKSRRVKEEAGRNGEQELRSCLQKLHMRGVKGFKNPSEWGSLSLSELAGPALLQLSSEFMPPN